MAGEEIRYEGNLKMNISTIYGITITAVGDVRSEIPDTEIINYRDREVYRKIFIRDNRIIGLILIGRYEDVGVLVNLIRSRVSLGRFLAKYKGEPLSFNRIYEEELFGQL